MQQGAQNALDKLRKRSPTGRRALLDYLSIPILGRHITSTARLPSAPPKTAATATSGRLRCCVRTHKPVLFCHRESRLG